MFDQNIVCESDPNFFSDVDKGIRPRHRSFCCVCSRRSDQTRLANRVFFAFRCVSREGATDREPMLTLLCGALLVGLYLDFPSYKNASSDFYYGWSTSKAQMIDYKEHCINGMPVVSHISQQKSMAISTECLSHCMHSEASQRYAQP